MTILEARILLYVFAATMVTVDGNVTVLTEQVVKHRSERRMGTSIYIYIYMFSHTNFAKVILICTRTAGISDSCGRSLRDVSLSDIKRTD